MQAGLRAGRLQPGALVQAGPRRAAAALPYVGGFTPDGTAAESLYTITDSYLSFAPVALSGGKPLLAASTEVDLLSSATGLAGATITRWPFEAAQAPPVALTVDAGDVAWVADRHGTELEILHAAPQQLWVRENLGPADGMRMGLAVGANGAQRACFGRGGKVMVY
jgi:hypothetical protein